MKNEFKIDPKFDCEFQEEMVCPYCGVKQSDSWESAPEDECGESACQTCGKKFLVTAHREISYSTQCAKGEHSYVTDDYHIPDAKCCERCGDTKFSRFDK